MLHVSDINPPKEKFMTEHGDERWPEEVEEEGEQRTKQDSRANKELRKKKEWRYRKGQGDL